MGVYPQGCQGKKRKTRERDNEMRAEPLSHHKKFAREWKGGKKGKGKEKGRDGTCSDLHLLKKRSALDRRRFEKKTQDDRELLMGERNH